MAKTEYDEVLGKDKERVFHEIRRYFSRERFLGWLLDELVFFPSDLEQKEVMNISELTIDSVSNAGKEYSREIVKKESSRIPEAVQFASTDETISGLVRHVDKSSFSEEYNHNGYVLVLVNYYGQDPEEYYKLANAVQAVNMKKCKGEDITRS